MYYDNMIILAKDTKESKKKVDKVINLLYSFYKTSKTLNKKGEGFA